MDLTPAKVGRKMKSKTLKLMLVIYKKRSKLKTMAKAPWLVSVSINHQLKQVEIIKHKPSLGQHSYLGKRCGLVIGGGNGFEFYKTDFGRGKPDHLLDGIVFNI